MRVLTAFLLPLSLHLHSKFPLFVLLILIRFVEKHSSPKTRSSICDYLCQRRYLQSHCKMSLVLNDFQTSLCQYQKLSENPSNIACWFSNIGVNLMSLIPGFWIQIQDWSCASSRPPNNIAFPTIRYCPRK